MRGRLDRSGRAASPRGACRLLWALAVLAGLAWATAAPVRAEDPATPAVPGSAAGGPGPPPEVPLDRLFELPAGFELEGAERRGGADANQWRQRFRDAREQLESSRSALQGSKAELAELAQSSDAWTVAPPVGAAPTNANDAPLSYALRQRIQREEAAVKRGERRLLDLEVEANLAGVPEDWRR